MDRDDDREIIRRELNSKLYTLERRLGQGNFADVWKAHHRLGSNNKLTVAIKVIDKTQRSESDLTKIYREIEILKKLRHPHIIRLYQVFESGNYIFLVTELCGKGELFDKIVDEKRLPEDKARGIFSEILSAVEHAHANNIVHRDLKTENVLLDENGNVKLADFGFGQYFSTDSMLNTWCGSPPYAAPEVFEGREYIGPELDCWSLGCILYVLVVGTLPFDAPDMAQLKELIINGRYQIPWFITNECFDLIKKCLTPNPKRRIKIADIRNHVWLCQLQSIVEPKEPIINQNVLNVMENVGIERQKIIDAVQTDTFDGLFALYHLLLDKEKSDLRNYSHQHHQYPTTNHFHPSVDQYGYPMMNNRLPNQNPQSMDQSQRGSNQRRHTVNNVLSTISIQQQQNLQRVYQQNHIGNENPSPRHSPVNHQINHHHDSSQPSSNHMVIQQSQVQQQQQHLIPLRMNHFQPHMMPQLNQQPTPRSTTAQGIHPRFPPSNQLQTPMQQSSVPQPNTFNQNEQRPWRQGRRASDGLLNGINQDHLSLFEQINPIQMIEEAADDYDHTWSSIRHPATNPMPNPNRQRPNRTNAGPPTVTSPAQNMMGPNQRYQINQNTLPVVTEEIQNTVSQLHISNESHLPPFNSQPGQTPMSILLQDMIKKG